MSGNSKVVVFSATSRIGHSVAHHLAKSGRYQVVGVTCDTCCPRAMSLKADGVDLQTVSYDDRTGLDKLLCNASGCFLLTESDLTRADGKQIEVRQGRAIADACFRQKVAHIVCSTYVNVDASNGLFVRHMDAKAETFQYMQELSMPITALLVPCLYEDLLETPLKPIYHNGVFQFGIPIGQYSFDMMASDDVGKVVQIMFSDPQYWRGKTLNAVGDKRTVPEIAAIFSSYFHPLRFVGQQLTSYGFRLQYQHLPGVNDLANQFDYYMLMGQRSSLALMRRLCPGLQGLSEWVQRNAESVHRALDPPPSATASPQSDFY